MAALLWVVSTASAVAQDALPPLTQPVNDFANVIDPASEARLDDLIRRLQSATGDTIIVATRDTLAPFADVRELSVKWFENGGRGIGDKDKDAGILFVLLPNDRAVRIEVGYGLEGVITDGFCGQREPRADGAGVPRRPLRRRPRRRRDGSGRARREGTQRVARRPARRTARAVAPRDVAFPSGCSSCCCCCSCGCRTVAVAAVVDAGAARCGGRPGAGGAPA